MSFVDPHEDGVDGLQEGILFREDHDLGGASFQLLPHCARTSVIVGGDELDIAQIAGDQAFKEAPQWISASEGRTQTPSMRRRSWNVTMARPAGAGPGRGSRLRPRANFQ